MSKLIILPTGQRVPLAQVLNYDFGVTNAGKLSLNMVGGSAVVFTPVSPSLVLGLIDNAFGSPDNVTLLADTVSALIPVMTSDNAPSGIVTESDSIGTGFRAVSGIAFDGQPHSYWTSPNGVPQWLQYQFPTSHLVTGYQFYTSQSQSGSPLGWTLQGSNDGNTWTTLDTVTGFMAPGAPAVSTFNFSNLVNYTYYRITVTSAFGPPNVLLSQFQLLGY